MRTVDGVLVAPVDQLEEEDGTAPGDREVADLVDDQERGVGEGLAALVQTTGGLGVLERVDQVGQGSVVDLRPLWAVAMARLMARCVLPTPG